MIIGVTGTNGAGKGMITDYLVKQHGFAHYSARGFIVEEIERRGLPVDRNNTNMVANDLRKMHGPEHVIKSLFERARNAGGDVVIESVRTLGEAVFLKEHGAFVVAADADRKVRYERSVARGTALDKVTFEEFCAQEDRELAQKEAYDMNVLGVMEMADYTITNDGTLAELNEKIEMMLTELAAR